MIVGYDVSFVIPHEPSALALGNLEDIQTASQGKKRLAPSFQDKTHNHSNNTDNNNQTKQQQEQQNYVSQAEQQDDATPK